MMKLFGLVFALLLLVLPAHSSPSSFTMTCGGYVGTCCSNFLFSLFLSSLSLSLALFIHLYSFYSHSDPSMPSRTVVCLNHYYQRCHRGVCCHTYLHLSFSSPPPLPPTPPTHPSHPPLPPTPPIYFPHHPSHLPLLCPPSPLLSFTLKSTNSWQPSSRWMSLLLHVQLRLPDQPARLHLPSLWLQSCQDHPWQLYKCINCRMSSVFIIKGRRLMKKFQFPVYIT